MNKISDKQKYYELAHNSFNNISVSEIEIDTRNIKAKNRSISIIVDDIILPTSTFVVRLDLLDQEKLIGNYEVCLNDENEIFDDFLRLY